MAKVTLEAAKAAIKELQVRPEDLYTPAELVNSQGVREMIQEEAARRVGDDPKIQKLQAQCHELEKEQRVLEREAHYFAQVRELSAKLGELDGTAAAESAAKQVAALGNMTPSNPHLAMQRGVAKGLPAPEPPSVPGKAKPVRGLGNMTPSNPHLAMQTGVAKGLPAPEPPAVPDKPKRSRGLGNMDAKSNPHIRQQD